MSVSTTFRHTKAAATFIRKTIMKELEKDLFKEVHRNIGSAQDGTRVWPKNRRDDKKFGVRIDWGQKFQNQTTMAWYRNMVLQFNSDADNPGIKNEVGKNRSGSHAQRAVTTIALNDDGTEIHSSVDEAVLKMHFIDKLNDGA